MVHYRAGKYQLALGPPQDALRLDDHWRYAITSHSVLAMAYHRLDRPERARQALRDAAQKVDQWQQSLLGPSLDMGPTWGDVVEGLVLYREAKLLLEGSPPADDPRPIVARARAFAALGDHGKADESCGRAMESGGEDLAVRLACARIRASLGLWDKVATDLREGIESGADEALVADCHYLRATAHLRLGRFAEAVADYTKALALAADSPSVHNDLAWLLATCPEPKFRDPQRAVECATKAIALAPKDGFIWNTLGAARYRAGNWKAAIEALDKSRELRNGGDAFDFFFLSMAHWQQGSKDEARKWYAKSVEWMDQNAKDNDELRRFRSEAEELLEIRKQ
jgi:tetratricopeptide (TPR) repeat protein